MRIQRYTAADEDALFDMLKEEGNGWSEYYSEAGRPRCREALQAGVVYLLYAQGALCGYIRGHEDYGFGVYIHDLLVGKQHRGKQYGRLLMERVCRGGLFILENYTLDVRIRAACPSNRCNAARR